MVYTKLINEHSVGGGLSLNKPAGNRTYQHFSELHKHHQDPLAWESFFLCVCFLLFASRFLLRIESHCDSVRDKSRCVLALPAAASIATRAVMVLSMGRVIWLKNKQQSPEERQDSWPAGEMQYYRDVILSISYAVLNGLMLHFLYLPETGVQIGRMNVQYVSLCELMIKHLGRDTGNNRRVGWGFHA